MSLLSDHLRRLRSAAGMTQPALAQKLGISRSAVAMYENGSREPELSMLCALADIYGISLDELVGREHPASPQSLKLALFGCSEVDDLLLDDAKAYAAFLLSRQRRL